MKNAIVMLVTLLAGHAYAFPHTFKVIECVDTHNEGFIVTHVARSLEDRYTEVRLLKNGTAWSTDLESVDYFMTPGGSYQTFVGGTGFLKFQAYEADSETTVVGEFNMTSGSFNLKSNGMELLNGKYTCTSETGFALPE